MVRRAFTCLPLAIAVLSACAPQPPAIPVPRSVAAPPVQGTPVQTLAEPWLAAGDRSGVAPLSLGRDALAARLSLIDAAEVSVDLQVFEMQPDRSVRLVEARLRQAADRGVRVRLLVDDILTSVSDRDFADMDAHPNIEVRLYNPLARAVPMPLGWLVGLPRSNRRMHNKALIVDNAIAIVGGRNFSDAYFEASPTRDFVDFELVAAGPVAAEVSESFDAFWNDARSVPVASLARAQGPPSARISPEAESGSEGGETASAAVARASDLERDLRLRTAPTWFVADRPEKLRGPRGQGAQRLFHAIDAQLAEATEAVILVTPYFVPREEGVARLRDLRARGVDVTVITNSLASTNHAIVHGGYAPHRRALLEAGVRLHEMRPDAALSRLTGGPVTTTLHSKIVVIDRRLLIVGSFNLDPRSIELNSENAMFVRSARFAGSVGDEIERMMRDSTYALGLDADGNVVWDVHAENVIRRWQREPGASPWRRIVATIVSAIPGLEDQL